MALGELWLEEAVRGRWTLPDFPDEILVGARPFRRAFFQQPYDGVIAQYREDTPQWSRHLKVRSDLTWEIHHLDQDNPDHGRLIEHGLNDTPRGKLVRQVVTGAVTVGAVAAIGYGVIKIVEAVFGGGRRR